MGVLSNVKVGLVTKVSIVTIVMYKSKKVFCQPSNQIRPIIRNDLEKLEISGKIRNRLDITGEKVPRERFFGSFFSAICFKSLGGLKNLQNTKNML